MDILAAAGRIVDLGGAADLRERVARMRESFEERTGRFAPDDPWFEERSRAFWCDAITRGRFGREVQSRLGEADGLVLEPLERAHRGLFRASDGVLVDLWSGAELEPDGIDESSREELAAGAGQLLDARIVGVAGTDDRAPTLALLPGGVFHPRHASSAIEGVIAAAKERSMGTHDVLDALLRMERMLRSLSRVKASYAYRPEALSPQASAVPLHRSAKGHV